MRNLRKSFAVPGLLVWAATACSGSEGSSAVVEASGNGDSATGGNNSITQSTVQQTTPTTGANTVGVGVANTTAHDDPVDSFENTSWSAATNPDDAGALVRVLLTDAPVDAESVFVTICGIDVEMKSLGTANTAASSTKDDSANSTAWYRVSEQCQEVDLLTLRNGITEAVGIGSLPPGEYAQIRLMLREAAMLKDGVKHALALGDDGKGGFAFKSEFAVGQGEATTIVLDFDANQSIQSAANGGFSLHPVLSVIATQTQARVRLSAGEPAKVGEGINQGGIAGQAAIQQQGPDPSPRQGQGGDSGFGLPEGSVQAAGPGGAANQGSTGSEQRMSQGGESGQQQGTEPRMGTSLAGNTSQQGMGEGQSVGPSDGGSQQPAAIVPGTAQGGAANHQMTEQAQPAGQGPGLGQGESTGPLGLAGQAGATNEAHVSSPQGGAANQSSNAGMGGAASQSEARSNGGATILASSSSPGASAGGAVNGKG